MYKLDEMKKMDLAKMIDINLKEISETIENNEKSQKCPLPQDSGKNIDLDNK